MCNWYKFVCEFVYSFHVLKYISEFVCRFEAGYVIWPARPSLYTGTPLVAPQVPAGMV